MPYKIKNEEHAATCIWTDDESVAYGGTVQADELVQAVKSCECSSCGRQIVNGERMRRVNIIEHGEYLVCASCLNEIEDLDKETDREDKPFDISVKFRCLTCGQTTSPHRRTCDSCSKWTAAAVTPKMLEEWRAKASHPLTEYACWGCPLNRECENPFQQEQHLTGVHECLSI